MMPARRFLNLVYGALTEHLGEADRDRLDQALEDEDVAAERRMAAILAAGGEFG
jgi:hypothetical protein